MGNLSLATLTRRASLLMLSAAGVTSLGRIDATSAKKKHRKKGDVNKLCKHQVGECNAFTTARCESDPDCLAELLPCCERLRTCDFGGFLACLPSEQPPE